MGDIGGLICKVRLQLAGTLDEQLDSTVRGGIKRNRFICVEYLQPLQWQSSLHSRMPACPASTSVRSASSGNAPVLLFFHSMARFSRMRRARWPGASDSAALYQRRHQLFLVVIDALDLSQRVFIGGAEARGVEVEQIQRQPLVLQTLVEH